MCVFVGTEELEIGPLRRSTFTDHFSDTASRFLFSLTGPEFLCLSAFIAESHKEPFVFLKQGPDIRLNTWVVSSFPGVSLQGM